MPKSPKPGGAVIEPRTFTASPKKFASTSTRLRPGPVDSPQHAAAELQHATGNAIREYLLDRGMTLRAFCEERTLPDGLSYERFYRISNGTTMMGLTDIMFWASVLPGFAATLDRTIRNLVADMDTAAYADADDGHDA